MPTYEYLCTDCANQWEEIQKISEPALEVCPKCGKTTAKRQISGGSFILKGGGWYADLYSSSPKKGGRRRVVEQQLVEPQHPGRASEERQRRVQRLGLGRLGRLGWLEWWLRLERRELRLRLVDPEVRRRAAARSPALP